MYIFDIANRIMARYGAQRSRCLNLGQTKMTTANASMRKLQQCEPGDAVAVKSLRKALAILGTVAASDHRLTIAEVAIRSGVSRPTAYRLVQTLAAEGYLEQDSIYGRLSIGFATLPLAANLLDRNRMRTEALPHLQRLAKKANERANLGILYRNRVLYLAGVEKPTLPTIYSRFGKMVPVHCCALGKAILAYLPEAELRMVLEAEPLVARTPNTITQYRAFRDELKATNERGYAIDNAENVYGSYCVAAPIFDTRNRPAGAIGLSSRVLEPILAEAETIRHAAELISHLLHDSSGGPRTAPETRPSTAQAPRKLTKKNLVRSRG